METENKESFIGRVVKIGRPKLYTGGFGTFKKFFVLFEDRTKSMFAIEHYGKFVVGDTLQINGIKQDEEWLNVGTKSRIEKANPMPDEEERLFIKFKIGYVKKTSK